MNEFEIKLEMLLSALDKKKEALSCTLNITENQHTLLSGLPGPETAALFHEMNKEKQAYIDGILSLDEVFQSIFETITDTFDETAPLYKSKIAAMQADIKEVMELDVKIRATEQKNKRLTGASPKKAPPAAANSSRAKLLKQYEKNYKKEGL